MSKRKLLFFGGGAIALVVLLIVSYTIISNQHSPDKVVDAFNQAVKDDNTDKLKELIEPDKKEAKVNKSSLTAFIDYLKANNQSYQVIKDGLKKQIKDKDFTSSNLQVSLFEDSKTMGIFPNYKLKVKTVHLELKGDLEDDKIILAIEDSKEPLDKIDEKKNIYEPMLPGEYNIDATIKNKLGEFNKTKKTDVWGDVDVGFLIDIERLASEDEFIQKEIVSAANEFNENVSVYVTSGFDASEYKNITDDFKENISMFTDQFNLTKEYIEEIQSQFTKSIVNLDDFSLNQFDGDWKAQITMIVSYNEKIKFKFENTVFEDFSYTELREYHLKFDEEEEKWMIDDVIGKDADESDADDWDNKDEIEIKDPKLREWSDDDLFI